MTENIRYEIDGPVRLITITRAEKMNSLTFDANDDLIQAWQTFNKDEDARVAVITGAGDKAFCAGADLKNYTMAFATQSAPAFRRNVTDQFGIGGITRGLNINKPIIAAVNGYAISGGFEIALACDIRFCAPHAQFALQDVQWGFHACDGGLIRLKELIGTGNAMEMILSGDLYDAEFAFRTGLVNRIVDASDLITESMQYAHHLATRAPLPQHLAKDVMRRITGMTQEEALKLESSSFHNLAFTEDLAEGTRAFAEKRVARFKGK